MSCSKCAASIEVVSLFCNKCGTKVENKTEKVEKLEEELEMLRNKVRALEGQIVQIRKEPIIAKMDTLWLHLNFPKADFNSSSALYTLKWTICGFIFLIPSLTVT